MKKIQTQKMKTQKKIALTESARSREKLKILEVFAKYVNFPEFSLYLPLPALYYH